MMTFLASMKIFLLKKCFVFSYACFNGILDRGKIKGVSTAVIFTFLCVCVVESVLQTLFQQFSFPSNILLVLLVRFMGIWDNIENTNFLYRVSEVCPSMNK